MRVEETGRGGPVAEDEDDGLMVMSEGATAFSTEMVSEALPTCPAV